jgi:hypothetical protein
MDDRLHCHPQAGESSESSKKISRLLWSIAIITFFGPTTLQKALEAASPTSTQAQVQLGRWGEGSEHQGPAPHQD